ncbi:NAD(P)H-dependent flavin oxidoreductase [Verticiella sediminum]|nr:nitronate monooxygenase [Verticiella sediminum]
MDRSVDVRTRFVEIQARMRLPVIVAPMLRVSGPALVAAVRAQGAVGAFPTANARSVEELDDWVAQIKRLGAGIEALPPYCPNLIMRQARLKDDLACLLRHGVEMVITSVGSPAPVVQPLHDIGCLVFADVASIEHAEKALRAGADGLILLTAGAGGQTGWANGFAFVRAVRAFFDGPLVMAGGMSDGAALLAAQVAGCDLGYMGTRFIATRESMAAEAYKAMLVESRLDDVMLTRAFTGLDANMLRPSVVAAGLDPANLEELNSEEIARRKYGGGQGQEGPKRWKDIWSAGHSVSGIDGVDTVAGLMARTREEYESARQRARRLLE